MRVSAVILAAGGSSRMGENKLLLPWGETTVVGAVASAVRDAGLIALAVTSRDAEAVARAVAPMRTVVNPEAQRGMGRSIALGVETSEPSDGYLITLGDMPTLTPGLIARLIAALRDPYDVVAPFDEAGKRGHPVLFGGGYRDALMRLDGDTGARSLIEPGRERHVQVERHLSGFNTDAEYREVRSSHFPTR